MVALRELVLACLEFPEVSWLYCLVKAWDTPFACDVPELSKASKTNVVWPVVRLAKFKTHLSTFTSFSFTGYSFPTPRSLPLPPVPTLPAATSLVGR